MLKLPILTIGKHGKVRRAFIGIVAARVELRPHIARRYGFSKGLCVGVMEVQKNSPAHHAGLRHGDILVSLGGGGQIHGVDELLKHLDSTRIGVLMEVIYLRKGELCRTVLTAVER